MATFTDLSQSTQAGDPLVSTLTSGLDRNLIAAFEGDPTATLFIQAQDASMTDGSVTFPKQGDQSALSSASVPVASEKLYGTWGGYGTGGFIQQGYLSINIPKAGKYRIVGELEVTANESGGNGHPSSASGNARCQLRKNTTTFTGTPDGTLIASSPTWSTYGTRAVLDVTHDLLAGETLQLFLDGYSHQYAPNTQFILNLKLFSDVSNVEGVTTVGRQYFRELPAGSPVFIWTQTAELGHIDWLSTPYGGEIS
jgi:hypothetical protein